MFRPRMTTTMAALVVGLATSAAAQQPATEQDVRQSAESMLQARNKAVLAKDAVAAAALFTDDAIVLGPGGPIVGRAAIEKAIADNFKVSTPNPSTLDQVIMVGDAVRLKTGSWSGTLQTPSGPVPRKGYWSSTDVRDGNTWKIRMETVTVTPPPPSSEAKN